MARSRQLLVSSRDTTLFPLSSTRPPVADSAAIEIDDIGQTKGTRRRFMASGLLASATLLLGETAVQAKEPISSIDPRPAPSLPWVKDPLNPKRSTLRVKDAEALGYNLSFVTYLARFLLNFDPLAQQWWINGAQEIPKKTTDPEIFQIRQGQFSRFAASVELGLLQEFSGPDGPKQLLQSLLDRFCSLDTATSQYTNSTSSDKRLVRESKEARRQLALLFGLLNGDFQPTAEITKLLASVDNGSVASITLSTDSSFLRGFSPGDTPAVDLPAPQAGDGYTQATVKPILTPTGELLRLDILQGGKDEVFQRPPTIAISPPLAEGGRAAQAVTKIKRGSLVGIQLTDPGKGYTLADNIQVMVESSSSSSAPAVTVQAVLEMAVSAIEVVDPGNGYAVEKPLRVSLVPSNGGKPEVIGLGYSRGERGSFTTYRQAGDNKVRSFEIALDEQNGGVVSGTSSGGSLPSLPFTSKASSSQQLLSLLPQGFGLEYDKEKKKYFLTVEKDFADKYNTPSSSFSGRLVPDFGPRGESPIERNMQLSMPTILRLCLSGAICSSGVHLALTPLDVVKTKVQTNPIKYPKIGGSFSTIFKEEGVGTFFTGWAPTLFGNFIAGGVLYAMTELIRRSLTETAGANAESLEVFIILAAAGTASATAAVFYCPFEAVRIRTVAQPKFASNAVDVAKRMVSEEGLGSLTNAIPVFLVKQVPYACVKFTIFDLSTEFLYRTYPAAQEDLKLSLLISLVGGVMGGVAAAVVSNPADAVIAELKKSKSDQSPQEALQALLDRAGVSALFKGLPLRMVFYSLAASLQFLVFDGVRFALGIGPDDLRLYLDVLGGALAEKGTIA